MTATLFAAFLRVLEVIRPAFSDRVFANLVVILIGWVRTQGRHAITEALLVTGLAARRDHSAFHRIFSAARWNPDEVGRRLLMWILDRLDGHTLRLVVDDTLAPHKGPRIFGLGCYLDPVTSTRRTKSFRFGHNWVVLSIVVPLPFAARPWALPILFRLYRTRSDCEHRGDLHRKKTELAREMIETILAWLPERRMEMAIDQAYCNRTVLRGLPSRLVVFGALRPDAALYATNPTGKGKGCRLPTPQQMALDPSVPWSSVRIKLYGRLRTVKYKTYVAQWHHVLDSMPVRVVLVQCETGTMPLRVFFCTDPEFTVPSLLHGYSERWPAECTFRDSKQFLGFAESSARNPQAVLRTTPMIGLLYTLLVLWFHECQLGDALDVIPYRPWYPEKCTVSFADVLRTAQETFARIDLPTKLPRLANFGSRRRNRKSAAQLPLPFAT